MFDLADICTASSFLLKLDPSFDGTKIRLQTSSNYFRPFLFRAISSLIWIVWTWTSVTSKLITQADNLSLSFSTYFLWVCCDLTAVNGASSHCDNAWMMKSNCQFQEFYCKTFIAFSVKEILLIKSKSLSAYESAKRNQLDCVFPTVEARLIVNSCANVTVACFTLFRLIASVIMYANQTCFNY